MTLYEYPIWLWAGWPLRRGARLRSTVDAGALIVNRRAVRVASGPYLAGKLHALDAHRSQLRRPAGVPEDAEWPALPAEVLAAASADAELFLPVG